MEFQWGKNPEYTVHLSSNLDCWALPLVIRWYRCRNYGAGSLFNISIELLCFGFEFEIWKWKK